MSGPRTVGLCAAMLNIKAKTHCKYILCFATCRLVSGSRLRRAEGREEGKAGMTEWLNDNSKAALRHHAVTLLPPCHPSPNSPLGAAYPSIGLSVTHFRGLRSFGAGSSQSAVSWHRGLAFRSIFHPATTPAPFNLSHPLHSLNVKDLSRSAVAGVYFAGFRVSISVDDGRHTQYSHAEHSR